MFKIVYSKIINDIINDSFLPMEVKIHIDNKEDKKASLYAWYVLNQLVFKTYGKNLNEFNFSYNKNGKPLFDKFYVSLSHSDEMIVVALSDFNIAIDLQKIYPNKDYKSLISNLCIDPNTSKNDFIKYFTQKEVMVKYNGLKLGYPKKQLCNNDDVASIMLFDDYMLSYYPKVEVELYDK